MSDFASNLYGIGWSGPTAAAPTAHMTSTTMATGVRGLVDPNNPLMWFGVLALIAFGAVAVSGSVRLGRAHASAAVGTS